MEQNFVSEKRKHPRFNVDLPVKYARSKFFKSGKYGRAVNASEGGLLVHLPEETEIGQHLALQLFFYSPSELNILETSVRVVWKGIHVRKDMGWDYRTGVSFTDLPPEDMSKFRKFLISFSQQPPYTS
ncbi:MAG TPA: PilZ domain-containing protein [Thermodesulfobacteriota bacterium]|nr:PilZ domain-containing protein [Thermodesulfobacteriota bacterium]